MNFQEFFESLEQMDQSENNYQILKNIMKEDLIADISFDFTSANMNLREHLSGEQLEDISKRYYSFVEKEIFNDWCRVLPKHEGKRFSTVVASNDGKKNRYRVKLQIRDITPEDEDVLTFYTKKRALELAKDFLDTNNKAFYWSEGISEFLKRYFEPNPSKVFAVRITLTENQEDVDKKIAELKQKIKNYRNLNL